MKVSKNGLATGTMIRNLLLLGLLLRFVFIFLDFSMDVNSHIAWGKETYLHGFSGFYGRIGYETFTIQFPNYPPLVIYMFAFAYMLYSSLFSIIWWINVHVPAFPSGIVTFLEGRNAMAAFMKIPPILGDLGTAYLLYLFTFKMTKNIKLSLRSLMLIAFNPVIIYLSSLWGQIDILPVMFILWSIYVLFYSPHKLWSGVLFALALLAKQTAVIYVPLYIFLVIRKTQPKDTLKIGGACLAVFWLSFLPFYQVGNILSFPFITYLQKILLVSGLSFISNHSFNMWAAISQWNNIPDSGLFMGIPYSFWGYGVASLFLVALFYKYVKSKMSIENVLMIFILWNFTVFEFFTRIHERHFLPLVIFLIPLIWKDVKFKYIFYILNVFLMVNFYHNWAVPAIPFLLFVIRSPFTENLFVFTGLSLYFILLKDFLLKKDIK